MIVEPRREEPLVLKYGVFARHDHPNGGLNDNKSVGYVVLIVECETTGDFNLVVDALTDPIDPAGNANFFGLPEGTGVLGPQFGGKFDFLFSFDKVGDTEILDSTGTPLGFLTFDDYSFVGRYTATQVLANVEA